MSDAPAIEERLARLMPKVGKMDEFIGVAQGSHSPTELAGALAGLNESGEKLSEPAFLIGLEKFCLDRSRRGRLEVFMLDEAEILAEEKGWPLERGWKEALQRDPGILGKLASSALEEAIGTTQCEVCHGRQWVYPEGVPPSRCDSCCGTGRAAPSGLTLSAKVGVHPSNWTRYWGSKYRGIVMIGYGWCSELHYHMSYKLYGG